MSRTTVEEDAERDRLNRLALLYLAAASSQDDGLQRQLWDEAKADEPLKKLLTQLDEELKREGWL